MTSAAVEQHQHAPGTGYREPSPAVTRLLTATRPPEYLFNAEAQRVALVFREAVVSLDRLARPWLGLGGYRLDPMTRMTDMDVRVVRVEVLDIAAPAKRKVWIPPAGAELEHVKFAPDGRRLSGTVFSGGASRLALFDTAESRMQILNVAVNPAFGDPCTWLDATSLLCRTVPAQPNEPPKRSVSPNIIEHTTGPAPIRTYTNLLNGAYAEALFDYYFGAELTRIGTDGKLRRFPGSAGPLVRVQPSPDGDFALVIRLDRPYSHMFPASHFPRRVELWDLRNGARVETPGLSQEKDITPTRGRPLPTFAWRPGPATALGWIERVGTEWRWLALDPPTADSATELTHSEEPISVFGWSNQGTPYFAVHPQRGQIHYFMVREGKAHSLWQGSTTDLYGLPGRAIRTQGEQGSVLEHNGYVFMASDGLGDDGPHPYLDALNLDTLESSRVFTSPAGVYGRVVAIVDFDSRTLLVVRESETEPPNLYRVSGSNYEPITRLGDPYPELSGISRRVVEYDRQDGVRLHGTLYLPAGYDGRSPLPTLVWIYPREFSDAQYAEQMDERSFRFHHIRGASPISVTLAGYALLLNPTMPIIGDPDESGDEYLTQLVANAEAAVDYLIASGVSTPRGLAVGGHSYGAFSSANLLVHSDLFQTGMLFSGAYNRTLTPFGFQHEQRSFWKATEMYSRISPFFYADKINEPVLIVHGGADQNPGTQTTQARRFFHALVGVGAHARYVELPYESHHYRARENVLQSSAEMIDWLDRTIGPLAGTD
jgi:dipeptidyl aminopeptidase/acylaminoacyl peptidase